MEKSHSVFKWILVIFLATVVTSLALIYQSRTGPTKPLRVELWLNDEQVYMLKLPRSHGGSTNCLIEINIPDNTVSADLVYRRYPTSEEWQRVAMVRVADKLAAFLPNQPPAGKLEYYIIFTQGVKATRLPVADQAIIRFRGDVPAGIILPHVIFIFAAMFLSNLTLFLALFGFRQYRVFGWITLGTLIVGGLVFGPIVQKYAFGQFWTGFPNGMDLTDNKTLIAFVFWLIAVLANLRKSRRYLTVLAAIIMVVIFSIPHSAKGSELDPETGRIKTGMVELPTMVLKGSNNDAE
jgi:hypothetical protein